MNEYQLVIPMTGSGQRFKDAGYSDLKPMIQVDGKCFFEHVVDMFDQPAQILFIISKQEPQKNELISRINQKYPLAKIFEIDAHKLGPSYAIYQAAALIEPKMKIIVSYCDYRANWNSSDMRDQLNKFDGSILTYTGFHPHMTRSMKYAYVQINEEIATDIREKQSFTDNPLTEQTSAGCYGFKSKEILLKSLESQFAEGLSTNSEFYTSLTYKPLIASGGKVGTVIANTFCQWGTPEDLWDWNYWQDTKRHDNATCENCRAKLSEEMNTLILAAGSGKRVKTFTSVRKPFIRVQGKQLWEHALELSHNQKALVAARSEDVVAFSPNHEVEVVEIEYVTRGQADTARIALEGLRNSQSPVHVLSSDNLMCSSATTKAMEAIKHSDLVVWTTKGYPPAMYSPEHYSWLELDQTARISGFVGKKSPVSLKNSALVIGNFTFRNPQIALKLISELFDEDTQINGEFYLDSVIQVALESGLDVKNIYVDNFMALGTEIELQTYNYYWDVPIEH